MNIDANKFYKLKELAGKENTGLSYNYLRTECLKGKLRHIKTGSNYLISGSAILQLLGGEANADKENH